MTKLLYIGGYGHSGSTLLEYLMAGNPAMLACGEVVSSIRERDTDRKEKICSCGRGAEACPVWGFYHSGDGRALSHSELLQSVMQNAHGEYPRLSIRRRPHGARSARRSGSGDTLARSSCWCS